MKLIKELPKIAAQVLHNTRSVHPDMKDRLELVALAYGAEAVATDFRRWCMEQENHPQYPVSDYLKVVDSRLGSAPEETRPDLKDPQVAELVSLTYELTTILPSATCMAKLLGLYSLEEIKGALHEFVEGLEEKNVRSGMHLFCYDGGADAIILARRRRNVNGKLA